MRRVRLLPGVLIAACLVAHICAGQTWVPQAGGTSASLRGVSVVSAKVVWASGSGGTWLRTTDGGTTWAAAIVPGAEEMDFRGVRGIDERTAYLMSSGPGDKSRIYRTTDGGSHWSLLFTNPDATGFFDAIAFWDAQRGIVAGDAVGGRMTIFTTQDGGSHWSRQHTPDALPNEGAFAASNSCLAIRGRREAWLGTGGPGAARVLHSRDGGRNWSIATTPVRNDGASAGIFSVAFADARYGVAVGGDYTKDTEVRGNIAVTTDGGRTWAGIDREGPTGFRSAVVYLADRKMWVTTGTSGSDMSRDNGKTWTRFDSGAYNALGGSSSQAVWAVGTKGRIAVLQTK